MILKIYVQPTIEPVSLQDMKDHLRLNSGAFNDNLTPVQLILPGSHAIADNYTTHGVGTYADVLGYSAVAILDAGAFTVGTVDAKIQECDTATGTYTDWTGGVFTQVADDGMTTTPALAMGATPFKNVANGAFTYYVSGVACSKAATETAPGNDVIPQGKYGAVAFDIDAAGTITATEAADNATGYNTAVLAIAGIPARAATVARMGTVTAMKSDGAFTFGTTALNATGVTAAYTSALNVTDNAIYKIAYTGSKQYIRVVAKVLGFACEFGVQVVKYAGDTTEDTILAALITAVRQQVEVILQRALITQTWDAYLDEFPDKDFIVVPFGQLQSITASSFTYTDSDGTATIMVATTDFLTDTSSDPGRIVLPYGISWPTFTAYPVNPITFRFVCGYGATAASVPAGIRTAIKMLAEDMFNNRSATIQGTAAGTLAHENKAVLSLLYPYRLWSF
jgi:uncharacterized phiE125 gp8 family phage protein